MLKTCFKRSRLIAAALTIALCMPFLYGCAADAPSAAGTEAAVPQTDTGTETVAVPVIEKKDYKGYKFKVLAIDDEGAAPNEIYSESETGDALRDSIFFRNRAVEEALAVKIVPVSDGVTRNGMAELAVKYIMSGDALFDISLINFSALTKVMYIKGALVKLDVIPSLDVSAEWWDPNSLDALSVGGAKYLISGALNLNALTASYGLLFNKQIVEDLKLSSPYDAVRNGSWTLAKMGEMIKQGTSDLNGDGKMDDGDRYGLIATDNSFKYLLLGTGEELVRKNNKDIPELNKSERLYTAVERVLPVASKRYLPAEYAADSDAFVKFFGANKALFYQQSLESAVKFRAIDTDFGICPSPKLDEAQERYYSPLAASRATMTMAPSTNTALEMTGYVTDALGYYSMQYVTPAFYDATLTGKAMRDDESQEMLEIMNASKLYVINDIFNFGSSNSIFSKLTKSGVNDFASQLAAAENKITSSMDEFVKSVS